MSFYVYIVQCADKTFYTGIAKNVIKRIKEHNHSKEGAKYTKARRPVKLVYTKEFSNRSEAQKEEYKIKKLTRKQKEDLIANLNT